MLKTTHTVNARPVEQSPATEIALQALTSTTRSPKCRIVIIGDMAILKRTARLLSLHAPLHTVTDIRRAVPGAVNVLDLHVITPSEFTIGEVSAACGEFTIGEVSAACGRASYAYIIKAIELALHHAAAGVITNPINKKALRLGGINYPGHTEIFAEMTGVTDYTMLFYLRGVGVAHVTTHCSLRQAIERITVPRVLSNIRLLDKAMRRLGVRRPRIAVGGLNPHAGENGLFGDEERLHISPAIEEAITEGLAVQGPFPPDTVFMRAFRREFDGVVSMLHDHGFVALKSRDFEHGVNITIGLPIIRTSVGHGTAFDKAGKGISSPASLLSAIKAAQLLYKNRDLT